MKYDVLKVQGSGNTFFLIEGKNDELNWSEIGKWLCDPAQYGGADGLLVVLPSVHADAKMCVINADGSEASMCGNGLRCVARYVLNKLGKDQGIIETMKADLHVARQGELVEGIHAFAVEIAPVSFDLASLPMVYNAQHTLIDEQIADFSTELRYTAVSVPNPHLISIVPKTYIEDFKHQEQLAKRLNDENNYTPDGVNVSYVYPISSSEIFVRTYERGVGFTNACGTAMTASSLVASLLHIVDENMVTVYNPGGFVKCHVQQSGTETKLSLIGNATYIALYELNIDDENHLYIKEELTEQSEYLQKIKEVCIAF